MSRNKTYGDSCGVARALDAVGERWALLVVRELLLGPKRYTDLQCDLPGISPTVLSARLRELTDSGVVTHRRSPRPAAGMAYELTDWGRGLEAVLLGLGAWGSESPVPAPAAPLGLDSLVLALRSRLSTTQIDNDAAAVQFNVGDHVLTMFSDHGRVNLRRGEAHTPAATMTASILTLQSLAFTDRTLDDVLESGDATLTGDPITARRLLSLICSDHGPAGGGERGP